jgi:hypothetical protein
VTVGAKEADEVAVSVAEADEEDQGYPSKFATSAGRAASTATSGSSVDVPEIVLDFSPMRAGDTEREVTVTTLDDSARSLARQLSKVAARRREQRASVEDAAGEELGKPLAGASSASPPLVILAKGGTPSTIGRSSTRLSVSDARVAATDLLARRGHRDRKSGAFAVAGPETDAKEPERTERILANPFAFCRSKPLDAFQSREGFFMFRVNGGTFIGRWYRLLIILLNMVFGVLSGLQPLLTPGTALAVAQTSTILTLQLGVAFLCFWYLPDADRIIARFMAFQFLFEGLSTAFLLGASLNNDDSTTAANAAAAAAVADATTLSDAGGDSAARRAALLQEFGFVLSLCALATPMMQLIEQRFITPAIGVYLAHGGSPLALLAAAYMLAAALPKQIMALLGAVTGHDDLDAGTAAGSATANAGDDAAEAEDANGRADVEGDEEGEPVEGNKGNVRSAELVEMQGEDVSDAAARASKLLARAVAAKEASGKVMGTTAPIEEEEEEEEEENGGRASMAGLNVQSLRAATRLRAHAMRQREAAAADDGDDDGGDGDGGADD